jgi:threonyl-tRNA synthetase
MSNTYEPKRDALHRIRHSLAHVLAQAVVQLRPGSKLGFGPPTDIGFYYDFALSAPIRCDDFPAIEARMREIIREDHEFVREELPADRVIARLEQAGEPFKAEYARELVTTRGFPTLSFYRSGSFLDMCRGPHVVRTSDLPADAFRLRSVAGAYWRGDERRPMMTRIYAWCFETREELDDRVAKYQARLAHDHKRLGPALDIYTLDSLIGKGLPLWLPAGTAIREELEKLAREEEFKRGYQRVATPHITRGELYQQSGHLSHYRDKMFPPMMVADDDIESRNREMNIADQYFLRPMNCPHHHRIFAARPRSYRDLPLRLAEYGSVYRFEGSGELSGLLRVRGMTMNDAHIYCTQAQIKEEFKGALELQMYYFRLFGLEDYYLRLSLWDPDDPKGQHKYVDQRQLWAETEGLVRQALQESGLPFVEAKGEAAFYGPKVDVQFRTVTGREETFCTVQLDFAQPASDCMNLTYVGPDGKAAHPYVIHRAPLGTHERFIACLIEHFGGAFPTWLAPVQVALLPVSDKVLDYAGKVAGALRAHFVRAEIDASGQPLGRKVRDAEVRKIPNLVVLGPREQRDERITLRCHGHAARWQMRLDVFLDGLLSQIRNRTLTPTWDDFDVQVLPSSNAK